MASWWENPRLISHGLATGLRIQALSDPANKLETTSGERNAHVDCPTRVAPFLVALAVVTTVLIFAVLIFLPAGRMDWTHGWVYIGIVTINVLASWVCLLRWNPVLIERRLRFGKGTKTWDKIWAASGSRAAAVESVTHVLLGVPKG